MNNIKKTTDKDILKFILKYFPNFKSSNNSFIQTYKYENNGKTIGFISYSVIYDRAELEYIAVDEKYRGTKVSKELLKQLEKENISSISLEVNVLNKEAIKFYLKNGFKIVSTRKKYYGDSDGYLMVKEMR